MSDNPVDRGLVGWPRRGSIGRVHLELVVDSAGDATSGRRDPAVAVVVAVDATRGTTFGAVRRQVAAAASCDGGPFWCGSRLITDDDLLGLPPLLHGATLRSRSDGYGLGDHPATGPPGTVLLAVRSGPACGDVRLLPPGEHRVGRDAVADVVVSDPEMSRLHASVVVGPADAAPVVRDLGSTNGTRVGDLAIGPECRVVAPGDELRMGSSTMTLEPGLVAADTERASCRADGSGRLLINRPPRPVTAPPAATVPWPDEPVGQARTRLNLLAVAVPLVGALVLAGITRTPGFLAIAALSPLVLVGSWAGDLVTGRRSARAARREHERAVSSARAQVAAAVSAEEAWWRSTCPDLAALLWSVTVPRPDVWCRRLGRPDFLLCRLGLGDRAAQVAVTGTGPPSGPPRLTRVPVAVGLTDVGVLGVAGARSSMLPTVRALVAQVAGWHSPADVSLVVLSVGEETDWAWTRWLPHVTSRPRSESLPDLVSELDRRLAARGSGGGSRAPVVVVVMDGAESLRRLPGTRRLLTEGPAVGMVSICCDRDLVALPAECVVTVELGGGRGCLGRLVEKDGATSTFLVEGVDPGWIGRFAGTVAPLLDSSGVTGGQGDIRLVDLCEADVRDPAAVAEGWRRHPTGTRVPLGVGTGGRPVLVDLARDGPHALVAGTTGSGKSELLQTLVCALALANRPDRLSFVLVDYKGGAAFREAARLPHTVGLVTDLDGRLGARALRSMEAEVRRRERALRDAGCSDFGTYEATSVDPLPRLVLVVDEFAALVEDLPDFVGGLVAIAARGRSLGIHLVLATQRPAGVVSADIKANTNLRVALRVLDPADSVDVVDCRDASAIAATSVGCAVLRTGNDPVVHLQVARVTSCAPVAGSSVQVRRVDTDAGATADAYPAAGSVAGSVGEGPTDQALLVDAIRAAAREIGAGPSMTPWLPPLPAIVETEQLPAAPPGLVAIGMVDVPEEQRRAALTLGLDGGHHLLVVGGPRSGRTSALRLVATRLAERLSPGALHIHALDPSGGLADLQALPHCGTVAGRDDPARAARLLELLVGELDRRQRRRPVWAPTERSGARSDHDDPVDHTDHVDDPWVLLLVDDWEALVGGLEDLDHGRAVGLLDRVVREGGSVGFRVVAAGGRGALTGRMASSVPDRVVLRLSDPTDYALAGIAPRDAPAVMPPGRGLVLPGGNEVQLARPGPPVDRPTSVRPEAGGSGLIGGPGPVRLCALPTRARLDEALVGGKEVAEGAGWVLVGIGGDEAGAVGVDLRAAGPGMLVAGPPGSGRSTALAAMARWLVQQGVPVALVTHPRSPLHALGVRGGGGQGACVPVTTDDDRVLKELAATKKGLTALVDDVEAIADTAVEGALQQLLRPGASATAAVVVSGTTSELAATYRGLAVDVRRSRTGLLLGPPGPADGDLLGTRIPQAMTTPGPPGRGVLVVRGRPTLVQVPVDGE
ncbi:MAG TPA: FtsK/SpoIIIE domain-containing protein [Actinomycetes bacterium]|nr:FtsK/SpoIIIE domain-containing protein [Actinomycetes bacterium]